MQLAVLVEQTAEQVASTHPALPILADDDQSRGWIWRCKPERQAACLRLCLSRSSSHGERCGAGQQPRGPR
jgi:hypothetical protein